MPTRVLLAAPNANAFAGACLTSWTDAPAEVANHIRPPEQSWEGSRALQAAKAALRCRATEASWGANMVETDDDAIPTDVETDDEESATDVGEDSDHVGISLSGGAMLTWGEDPTYGRGWTLYYQDAPESPTAPVATRFIPGDRTDVAFAVEQARRWIYLVHIANSKAEDRRGNS